MLSLISEALTNSSRQKRKRGGRKATMGHGLHEYTRRNDGNKMQIEFTAGFRRPKKPLHAAKLSSEVGFYIRSKMPIATHWNLYKKDESIKHVIPEAIKKVAVSPHSSFVLTTMLLICFTIFSTHMHLYFLGKV